MASDELEEQVDLHEHPLNLISETDIDVVAGAIVLSLPSNFFLPLRLQERGSTDTLESSYVPMREVRDVRLLMRDPTDRLIEWDYRHNCINFVGCTLDRTVRLEYWRQLVEVEDENAQEVIPRAKSYLSFRTAALCAEFAGGDNPERAQSLNQNAASAMDRLMMLFVKNNQGNRVRRRPFRLPYRRFYNVLIGSDS